MSQNRQESKGPLAGGVRLLACLTICLACAGESSGQSYPGGPQGYIDTTPRQGPYKGSGKDSPYPITRNPHDGKNYYYSPYSKQWVPIEGTVRTKPNGSTTVQRYAPPPSTPTNLPNVKPPSWTSPNVDTSTPQETGSGRFSQGSLTEAAQSVKNFNAYSIQELRKRGIIHDGKWN